MKTCIRILIGLILSCSVHAQAQWNKLPTQYLTNYTSAYINAPFSAKIVFPAFIKPVGNGHIFISVCHNVGTGASPATYYDVFEAFDDFSSHRPLSVFPYYNGNTSYPPPGGSPSLIYARGDSAFSWVDTRTNLFKNKYTKNDFQTMDSVNHCRLLGQNNLITNCLTNHFLYSVVVSADSMAIIRSDLTSNNMYCKKMSEYVRGSGIIKPVNDSVVLFSCSGKGANHAKKFLLKTIDYGQNWNEIYIDSVNSILDHQFTSNDTGYILLSNNSLVKTIDGGNSWTPLTIPSQTLTCFSFFDDNHGYIGGAQGFLSKTNDGGQTWNNELSGTTYMLKELFTLNAGLAYFKDSISDLYKNAPVIVSVRNYVKQSVLSVFPNPANNNVTVTCSESEIGKLVIYNTLGQTVLETELKSKTAKIDISHFAKGIYTICIKESYTRLIKE